MKISKKAVIIIFTIVVTGISVCLNFCQFFMGNKAITFNFAISLLFLLSWTLFSIYWGTKCDKTYKKFILVYWGINIISFILIILHIESLSGLLIPFAIWYGSPVYGFRYLLNSNITLFTLTTALLGLIFSFLGYWMGLLGYKYMSNRNITEING
ncbi:hypothetical protein [Clostridium cylindrosporum]|uniref:Uncharacterized protein n=1 Tax=Clostridium cylindrosporum DSM 605 TaxID=1121307 RepID=A0A0J8DE90_CLOCY|nr:hypothetical protein [Clostridium cylindrosporum]KMT22503.1 hypothetical protein CLCY_10c00480 [Clostridium cylindrosporum DSM 605]